MKVLFECPHCAEAFKISLEPVDDLKVSRHCENCNKDISHKRADSRFCSTSCRVSYCVRKAEKSVKEVLR